MLEVIEINGRYYPKFDEEEWQESLRQEMKERGLKEGLKEGREQGIKEGIKQGIKEEKKQIAIKLKNKKYKNTEISDLTGLSINEINLL